MSFVNALKNLFPFCLKSQSNNHDESYGFDVIDGTEGEENEELLYKQHAKLYMFFDGEWKDRGVGEVKILCHLLTKSLRVLMRRDQILKTCLNHVLNEDVKYTKKDDKSWLFSTFDFSENVMIFEKFALRFKNKKMATQFMEAINEARAITTANLTELFAGRAVLYRSDPQTRKCTERVNVEIQIMENQKNETHYLRMYRDPAKQLVLNQRIDEYFEYKQLYNIPKCFCYNAIYFADINKGTSEKLAVCFEETQVAIEFKKQLDMCLCKCDPKLYD